MNTRDDLPTETTDPGVGSPSDRLIRYAASRMPAGLAERLEEEWTADLAAQHGALSRMRFALGCWWATQVIGRAPQLYGLRLSAASHGSVGVVNPLPSALPRRAVAFLVIVFLHIVAALALIYAISAGVLPIAPAPMTGNMYFEKKSATPPPPAPRVAFDHRPELITAIPPLGSVQYEPAESLQTATQPASSLSSGDPVPIRLSGGIGKGFPATMDFYPASSLRLGETGLTAVRVCVDDHGRLTAAPKTAVSSGSARLDEGALALARAGSGHYRSTTENGRPVSGCFQIGVRFALKG